MSGNRYAAALVIATGTILGVHACGMRATAQPLAQQEMPAGRLDVRTSRVIVFKDGHAMLVKTATGIPDAQGRVHTDQVPEAAILGCFWATRSDGQILGMHAEWLETTTIREESGACTTILELLRANKGKAVECQLISSPDKPAAGTIVEVLEYPAPEPARQSSEPTQIPGDHSSWLNHAVQPEQNERVPVRTVIPVLPMGGQYVAIRLADGLTSVIPVADVRSLSGMGVSTSTTRTNRIVERNKRLSFDVGRSAGPVTISFMYFSSGVRWIPTYRLTMPETGTSADLALQGEILNELEDISNVPVDLVVGVPNFRFKDVVSPLTLERTVRDALAAAAPSVMGRQNQMSNAMFSQRAGEWRGRDGSTSGQGEIPAEVGMGGEQDLFVYSVPSMTIGKGDRATLPIWNQPTDVKHLYTFDVDVIRDPDQKQTYYRSGRYAHAGYAWQPWQPPSDRDSPLELSTNEVWHQVELKNASETPWTTGAALVMGGAKKIPVCQELLTYTSVGGKTLLPLTVAVDMRGKFTEEELARTSADIAGTGYQFIKHRGTVEITNNRKDISKTRVTIDLGGRVNTVSDEGKVHISPYRAEDWGNGRWLLHPNPHSQVTWEIELKPGETRTLSFEGEYYWRP